MVCLSGREVLRTLQDPPPPSHVPCQVGAYEAEENAVEHLLRDVRDATYSKLSKTTRQRFRSLESLKLRLQEIRNEMVRTAMTTT